MKNFIKRLLFIILIIPFGILFSFEIFIYALIYSIKWVFTGNFNDFELNSFFGNILCKLIESK